MKYIGIDVGTHTGVAVWDSEQQIFLSVETMKIHSAMELVLSYPKEDIVVLFEDARQRKWFGSNSNAKLQGAGSVKRDSSIWEDFLNDKGIKYRAIAPIKGGTKWTAERFKNILGWRGKTSEHSRDAALMVYGL